MNNEELPRRFAPRNDSIGLNPVIKIRVLTKTDRHNSIYSAQIDVKWLSCLTFIRKELQCLQ